MALDEFDLDFFDGAGVKLAGEPVKQNLLTSGHNPLLPYGVVSEDVLSTSSRLYAPALTSGSASAVFLEEPQTNRGSAPAETSVRCGLEPACM